MQNSETPGRVQVAMGEIRELQKRMDQAKEPDPADVDRVRKLVREEPSTLSYALSASGSLRYELIEKITSGFPRGYLLAEIDTLKKELEHDTATRLEQLLIEHILTTKIRLDCAESGYNKYVVNQSISYKDRAHWEKVLTASQGRYLKAVESLQKVRGLARRTPALQINIAAEGGKQVNVQDDAK